ncbi:MULTISPECIES: serine protease [Streptomyces]|uniref:Serine protease n=1 Tax=Streptomyces venezuelae TaxID=54571 RepID=A0A5P2BGL1_STRVZ|nr:MULTISPECIES: serine protease [Streptomyces]NEA04347.1 trypsin-like peptidase domain-containing protein [Streptomyces sp. SID10116]MYY85587.1 serine protease [Streptomyces sp. SID335]MYZ12887.1 serine protease [Streptomyces sp. SID337]NDZ90164.1 trypsin-like peptidase domain-containing protein [Streptomyces sp. SID10115]NEB44608.1 trypsin-like peptidase domain-containing protein [Streptomyces sp. SID339]
MKKPLVGACFAALLIGATAAPATAAGDGTSAKPRVKAVTLAGTVALSNCSGSVVRVPDSRPTDPALVLSNGHCLESGFPAPGEVIVNKASSRSFTLLNSSGGRLGTIRASKIAYGTMTDTDMSLYQTTSTYRDIESRYGIKALELNAARPEQGRKITVASGYWKKLYKCSVDGFAYRLKEGNWTWKDSVRYTPDCQTIGGTSGSPVIDDETGKVVAVNNTGNESGERCTDNNPCEVDENGKVTVREGINYAQQTYWIVPCVGAGNKIDLNRAGCQLPKPSARR